LGTGAHFVIPVARWCVWPDAQSSGTERPDVRFVDASLRRRLGPLARAMLHVAHACAQGVSDLRLVFASRHGELGYTVALLRALAVNEPLSPTVFSLSVHNAAAGLFSAFRGDRAAASAVAAGDDTLGYALLEAHCQLAAEPERPVLMVYGDEPLPQEYRDQAQKESPARSGCAVCVLLASDAVRRTSVVAEASSGAAASEHDQAAAFIGHLERRVPVRWVGPATTWSWH